MSPILLATDLSPWCDRAKERAIWLARRDGRTLRVLTVLPDDLSEEDTRRAADRAYEQMDETLAAEASDVATETVVRSGEPWEEIGAEIRACGAGLLVMGRHRAEALRDFFLSPTAALLDNGPPVLQAVNLPSGPWRDVVVGTDFSPHSRRALEQAALLAPEASLHLLHVFDVPFGGFITNQVDVDAVMMAHRASLEAAAREAAATVGDRAAAVDLVLARGAVMSAFHQEVERLSGDLLVVGTAGGGHGGFGSTARGLTRDPPCDLLVVPPAT